MDRITDSDIIYFVRIKVRDIKERQIFLWASLVMTVYSGAMYIIKNKEVFSS